MREFTYLNDPSYPDMLPHRLHFDTTSIALINCRYKLIEAMVSPLGRPAIGIFAFTWATRRVRVGN